MSDEAKVLLRVGDVLHGPNGERALVGDLNVLGGVCDDCRHDAIRAYDRFERGWSVGSNVLDDLSSRRWIPASERLPEEDVDVLVYIPGADKVMALSYFPNPDSWTDCRSLYFDIDGSMWQPLPPLPEPPKP